VGDQPRHLVDRAIEILIVRWREQPGPTSSTRSVAPRALRSSSTHAGGAMGAMTGGMTAGIGAAPTPPSDEAITSSTNSAAETGAAVAAASSPRTRRCNRSAFNPSDVATR